MNFILKINLSSCLFYFPLDRRNLTEGNWGWRWNSVSRSTCHLPQRIRYFFQTLVFPRDTSIFFVFKECCVVRLDTCWIVRNSITIIKPITTTPLPTETKKATAGLVPGDILASFNSLSNNIFENSGASSTKITSNHEETTKKKCMHAPINHNITNTKSGELSNTYLWVDFSFPATI